MLTEYCVLNLAYLPNYCPRIKKTNNEIIIKYAFLRWFLNKNIKLLHFYFNFNIIYLGIID